MFATTFSTLALAATLINSATAAPTSSTSAKKAPYKQIAEWSHPNFFDAFDLYDGPDPTLGFVDYVNLETAKSEQLMGWIAREADNTTTAFVGADSTGKAPSGRSSVRLTSKQEFKVGTLAVIDLLHMPVGSGPAGAGLWPAIWFLSPEATWPYGGEIDIVEYVNPVSGADGTNNAMTLHTGPGCIVDTDTAQLGSLAFDDCSYTDSDNPGNIGCGVVAPSNYSTSGIPFATAGPDFNAQGGGVFVAEWTAEGISIWLFNRHILPQDILDRAPTPKKWTQKPLAKFSGAGCDFSKSFLPMNLIINVDICGSWAGEVYPGGQEACNAFAAENPKAYREAYFEFGGIMFYESS